MIDANARLEIARSLLGEIDERGFCMCPGIDYHSNKKRGFFSKIPRDCRVYLVESEKNPRGVPSIRCQHTSCASVIEEYNFKLRSLIGTAEKKSGHAPAPENREQKERREAARQRDMSLRQLAEEEAADLAQTLGQYATAAMDLKADGLPTSGIEQARALLSIFPPGDIVWCGIHAHSIGMEDALDPENTKRVERIRAARPFRRAGEWIAGSQLPGPRISPSAFRGGILSRSNQFIQARRFMVIEHDSLPIDKQAALMRWLMEAEGLNLRALIYTGGKSLHGWFDFPKGDLEVWKARLCGVWAGDKDEQGRAVTTGGIKFDPGSFDPSRPYRVPGWKHDKTGKPVELWRIHL